MPGLLRAHPPNGLVWVNARLRFSQFGEPGKIEDWDTPKEPRPARFPYALPEVPSRTPEPTLRGSLRS
jgi:hypothetical protein